MRKIVSAVVSVMLVFGLLGTNVVLADVAEIQVILNGERLEFDVPPQIINDRTMVPMRAIFEALGMEVEWNQETQTVWGQRGLISTSHFSIEFERLHSIRCVHVIVWNSFGRCNRYWGNL